MSRTASLLRSFLDASDKAALVEVTGAKGSTPREQGAWMLVAPTKIYGTIGGGQLEFMAIDKARELLSSLDAVGQTTRERVSLDVPLGPEIGQCCGGRVDVSIRLADERLRAERVRAAEADDASRPHVYLFGGGHVGQALACALDLLPVHTVIVETRADALDGMPEGVELKLTAVPEEMVRDAPARSAFVVLTHDHALDFLIVAAALQRSDAAYVGMIGSKTKKATFKSWYFREAAGTELRFNRLVSPIGGGSVNDKRPAVIAALATAEILRALSAG